MLQNPGRPRKEIAAPKAKDQIQWMYALCGPIIPAPDLPLLSDITWEDFIKDVNKSTDKDLGEGTANF